jgi:hypothetical protein
MNFSFEVASGQKVVGFGIDGEWESEYVPGNDAEFYFTEDGVKVVSKILLNFWS